MLLLPNRYRIIPLKFTLCWEVIRKLNHDIWISFVNWKRKKMQRWFLFVNFIDLHNLSTMRLWRYSVMEPTWKINMSQHHMENAKKRHSNIVYQAFPIFAFTLLLQVDLVRKTGGFLLLAMGKLLARRYQCFFRKINNDSLSLAHYPGLQN